MKSLRKLSAVFVLGLLAFAGIANAGSGYKVNGTDLDSIFAPYHSGWPQAAATGFKVNGLDLNARYAKLSSGSAAGVTGFKVSGGADLNTIFAAYGSTGVQVATQPSSVSGAAAAGEPSGTVTSNVTSTAGAKGGGSYTYTWHIASGSASFTNPSGSSTAVAASVNAGTTASGSMYCSISDGVTSVNTNTVPWSLQNTTPSTWTFSITAGQVVNGSTSTTGYRASPALGSGSNLTDNGKTVAQISDGSQTDGSQIARFVVSGFASDPGANWIASVSANGKTHTPGESSFSYSYSSGVATWTWSVYGNTSTWFNFASGSNYTVTVTF